MRGRVGETMQVFVDDLHLDENPVRISIRKETVKATRQGRVGRDVFITEETVELLKALLVTKNLKGHTPLFSGDDKQLRKTLGRWLRRLELDARIPGHKYYQIHPHVFRKFFFSNAVQAMGETATHAMMGHNFYLKTYFRKPLSDRQADYRKAIPNLLVMQLNAEGESRIKDEAKLEALKAVASSLGLNTSRMTSFHSENEEEQALKDAIHVAMKPKDDSQMVISMDAVENELKEGWQFVANLPNGKVVVRR